MSDSRKQKHPSGHGRAWRGDWEQRLKAHISGLGYDSLTAFSADRPLATFAELVAELGPGDFAQVQLHWLLAQEAEEHNVVKSCAWSMLVRFLRAIPGGWPKDRSREAQWPALEVLTAWQCAVPPVAQNEARDLVLTLLRDPTIPAGWMPSGPADPYLQEHLARWVPDSSPPQVAP